MKDFKDKNRRVLHIAAASMNGSSADVSAWLRREASVELSKSLYSGLARLLAPGASYDAALLCLDWFGDDGLEFVRRASDCGRPVYVYGNALTEVEQEDAIEAGALGVIDPAGDDLSALFRDDVAADEVKEGELTIPVAEDEPDDGAVSEAAPVSQVRVPWLDDPNRPVRKGPGRNGRDAGAAGIVGTPDLNDKRLHSEEGIADREEDEAVRSNKVSEDVEERAAEESDVSADDVLAGGALLTAEEMRMLLGDGTED